MLVDFNDPIEKVLFYVEGQSQGVATGFALRTENDPRHSCCSDCHSKRIEGRYNKKTKKEGVWCMACNTFTKKASIKPAGPSVTDTRNSGRSKPPIPINTKICNFLSSERGYLSPMEMLWLGFGHGSRFASCMDAERRAWDLITDTVYDSVSSSSDYKAISERGVSIKGFVRLVVGLSRRGRKCSRYAVAEHFKVPEMSLSSSRPAGRLYDAVVGILSRLDDGIIDFEQTL